MPGYTNIEAEPSQSKRHSSDKQERITYWQDRIKWLERKVAWKIANQSKWRSGDNKAHLERRLTEKRAFWQEKIRRIQNDVP